MKILSGMREDQIKLVSFLDMQSLVGFLSFCPQTVRLGRVFMRRLWDFINHFLRAAPRTTRRRIPVWGREDLEWWNNFDTSNREIKSLYTNACLYGLGGFYFRGSKSWEQADVNQVNAFRAVVQGKVLPANRRMKKNPDDPSINVNEVEAILLAFQIWAPKWQRKQVKITQIAPPLFQGCENTHLETRPMHHYEKFGS